MNLSKNVKSTTAVNTFFSPTKSKLKILNTNYFSDSFACDILAGRVKKEFSITYMHTAIIFILMLLAYAIPANAQTEYDEEEDYDDYYEDAYSTVNRYEGYGKTRQYKEEERYKKAYREEELYNGRYRAYDNANRNNSLNQGLGLGLGTGKHQHSASNSRDNDASSPTRKQEYTGPDRGLEPDLGNDGPGNISSYDPNDGKLSGGEDNDQFGPPPPPDEPDVPVDTAIPFLIVAGVGLAGFKFYIRRKTSAS